MSKLKRGKTFPIFALTFLVLSSAGVTAKDAGTITLYRDKMGVPHVFGNNEAEAYYGAGYALGQDRLAQSERARRAAMGRLAEINGSSALPADRVARVFALQPKEIEEALARISPEHRRMIDAVVAGLNLAIDEANADPENKIPYEFKQWGIKPERWSVADYVATIGANWRGFGSTGGSELLNLEFYQDMIARHGEPKAKLILEDVLPLDDPDAVPILSPEEFKYSALATPNTIKKALFDTKLGTSVLAQVTALREGQAIRDSFSGVTNDASRAFVVGGSRSATGRAMMLEATSENPDVHFVGGALNAVGFTTPPGTPPLMGRSPNHGWLTTTGETDVVDIFAEKLNPDNRYQYWHNGKWRDMERRTEIIKVKDGTDEKLEVATTIHGPVIAWDLDKDTAYSQQNALAGYEMVNWEARIEVARAKTLEEFERAVRMVPTNTNFVYAGADGRIGYWHAGRLPIRAEGVDPRFPVPGTGEYDWRGMVPPEKLPHKVDPAAGFFHVWNNKPAVGMTYGDTSRYGKSFRTWMGVALAGSKEKFSMDDMREINRMIGMNAGAIDLTIADPKLFTPYLAQAVEGDKRLQQAVELMANWNGVFEDQDGDGHYDDPGLTLFRAWVPIAQNNIVGATIGDWWERIDADKYIKYRTDVLLRAIEGKDAGLPMQFNWFVGREKNTVLRQTVEQALSTLKDQFGTEDILAWKQPIYWKYYDGSKELSDKPAFPGELHSDETMAGKLGLIPKAIPNNLSESWNVLMEIGEGPGQFIQSSTPIGGQSRFIDASGKAGPHTDDQLMLHAKFDFKRVDLDRETIARDAESVMTLSMPDFLHPNGPGCQTTLACSSD